ncbi:hippurate hydrolase [Arboricoccus pini]|uniref:Hippurate hydrolase n=1 Tax=Arboricoccus pini TaxID=1963835 RepID=A0A212QRB7_9PROT|nr:M20 aminoacylase family protein [Arboricoccus pini]SNB62079.1 hippurate hydrolase [Arboricoccus pini]
MPVINRVAEYQDELVAWRRHLHEHPELAYTEVETARFVAEKLRSFGVDEVHEGLGKTGVVGVLRNGSGKGAIGLRADMDALPMDEQSGVAWASRAKGRMHACGHDGHTTMLLGAARYLAETRCFDGTVYLIFQPAEEGGAGAAAMMQDGLFERFPAERVFGMHNWPDLPAGQFGMREGPIMAATAEYEILVKGKGCHAAMPHQGRDPIVAASLLVGALQSIVSRTVDPLKSAVVSTTRIAGGDAYNVIPGQVELWGTVRTYERKVQDEVEQRIRSICAGIALAQEVEVDLRFQPNYPATINSSAEARIGAEVARGIVGEDKVVWDMAPSMGGEDFAYMLEKKPGSYIWLGVGGASEGKVCHSPTYDFNDEMLPLGVTYWAKLTEHLLPRRAETAKAA